MTVISVLLNWPPVPRLFVKTVHQIMEMMMVNLDTQ
jgi:hypothetical protein